MTMDRETARSRSSTWPLQDPSISLMGTPPPDGPSPPGHNGHGSVSGEGATAGSPKRETPECESPLPQTSKSEPKKPRNAWGNMSYAELITQAILSSPEKRLTLSEIYEWIVANVPYFHDKANSPSTAGWKVRPERRHGRCLGDISCVCWLASWQANARKPVISLHSVPLPLSPPSSSHRIRSATTFPCTAALSRSRMITLARAAGGPST